MILLTDHKTSRLWLPIGGHVEPGEHPEATLERELSEELCVSAKVLTPNPFFLTVTKTVSASNQSEVSLWYLLEGDQTTKLDFDPRKFYRVRRFGLDALPLERTGPHMKRLVQKLVSSLYKTSQKVQLYKVSASK